jgi:hypothetical protein
MEVQIIGDSHVRIFKHFNKSCNLFNVVPIPRSATTLFRVQRDGIDALLNIEHERASLLEKNLIISKNPKIMIFAFGYVDILNNILKHPQNDWTKDIENYINKINIYCKENSIILIINVDNVPQPECENHTCYGNLVDRTELRDKYNSYMKTYCINNNIEIIEFYKKYENKTKTFSFDKLISEDGAHIGHNANNAIKCNGCELCYGNEAKYLYKILENKLIEIKNKY